MTITDLRRGPDDRRRLELFLDGSPRVSLAEEVVLRFGLRAGQHLGQSELDEVIRTDRQLALRELALGWLARQGRTRAELRRRLRARTDSASDVDAVLADLTARGLVDDADVADTHVRGRLRTRPRGLRGLLAELRARGIPLTVADRAVRDAMADEGATELELARAAAFTRLAARSRRRATDSPTETDLSPAMQARETAAERRRLAAFLSRRGFTSDVIRQVLSESAHTPSNPLDPVSPDVTPSRKREPRRDPESI
jgi:regulatory protein